MEQALLEIRQGIQDRRLRYIDFVRSVQIHTSQVWTAEEGGKHLLKRLRLAFGQLQETVRAYSDSNDNQAAIVDALTSVKQCSADLYALDRATDWNVTNIRKACDLFLNVLSAKPTKATKLTEQPTLNTAAYDLLNAIDELRMRTSCLGDPASGGLEERRAVVAQVDSLRRAVQSNIFAQVDTAQLVANVQNIKVSLASLINLRSRLTGEAGFLSHPVAHVAAQCDVILAKLSGPPARPRSALSIAP